MQKIIQGTFIVLTALVLVAAAAQGAAAQDPQPPPQEQVPPQPQEPQEPEAQEPAAEALTAEGELVSVDTEAQTITIKAADGTEQQFGYNDQTEVVGAADVAGLSGRSGARVTVHFEEGDTPDARMATKIEVQQEQ